ncbi:hypothetical protein PoB_007537400 [Plakobranchus ocellatus]|uniref:Uncharacterized protein n=1 Tax=Plakobranchus ocellatus TaxID=259542 RepID=A0AAV4DXS4_9GAST|nr:hypothetical protein PoB_007537400 [Plakobranchus ocellatus]
MDELYTSVIGGTVDSESALSSAGTLLSRVRALPTELWPAGRGVNGTKESESALRSAGIPLARVRAPPSAPWA